MIAAYGGNIITPLETIWTNLDWSILIDKLILIIPALLCITFHELSHGFVAYKLGDNTAKDAGRLTLNPIKHIDIIGLAMMVVVGFGWAKPVPVNMNKFENPKSGMAITALAGPVSNLILAIVFLFIYGLVSSPLSNLGNIGNVFSAMLINTAYLSCMLAVFNIIPISPLDGSKVLFALLPEDKYFKLMHYERYGMILLMVLVLTGFITPYLSAAVNWVFNGLYGIEVWSSALVG